MEYTIRKLNEIAIIEFNNFKNIEKFKELLDFCITYKINDFIF